MTNQDISVKCAEAMGWKMNHPREPTNWYTGNNVVENWNPAESIADAWVLVEWAKNSGGYFRFDNREPSPSASFYVDNDRTWRVVDASTAPLAICLAFLAWAKEAT